MKSINEKTAIIRDAILKNVAAKYIYLFGSYAYGEPTEDSDIDIYVVVPEDTGRLTFLYADIISDISDHKIFFVDMHLVRESVFNKRKNSSMFEKIILSKGKLLHGLNYCKICNSSKNAETQKKPLDSKKTSNKMAQKYKKRVLI
jgi:predicted nucleotidyltransferase